MSPVWPPDTGRPNVRLHSNSYVLRWVAELRDWPRKAALEERCGWWCRRGERRLATRVAEFSRLARILRARAKSEPRSVLPAVAATLDLGFVLQFPGIPERHCTPSPAPRHATRRA